MIDFECVDQTGIGTPVWIASTDPCVLRFSWKTSLACRVCIESDWQESVHDFIINLDFQPQNSLFFCSIFSFLCLFFGQRLDVV